MPTYAHTAPSTGTAPSSARTSARLVASVAAVLFAVCLFLTVASVNVPHKAGDAELLDWWQKDGNLNSGIASQFFAIASAVLFVVVINYVRTLFATTGSTQWTAFAHSMATVFAATLLVSSALRAVVGQMVQAMEEPLPGVDVLRYATGLNYTLIGTATMTALALTMVAVSVVVTRTHVLGAWVGYVGFVCAAIVLVAVAMLIGAYAIPAALLWALCLAVAIWRGPAA